MQKVLLLLGVGTLIGCQSPHWKPAESVMLDGFQVFTGSHCESSAMLNLLRYQGYEITEDEIIGAGAALGFFLDSSPFPFLGGRADDIRGTITRTAGIAWNMETGDNSGHGWEQIRGLLARGNPVVLRVDMRYLPYLYGGKIGPKFMSFGGHYVCIAGIDAERETAYVTDTEHPGLQEIKLSDLDRARFSETKMFPPMGEFYWTEKAPPGFTFDWERIALESLGITEETMTGAVSRDGVLLGLDGMSKWADELARLDTRVPPYLLGQVLAFHYGCIETNGTGGAAFRKLYHAFLVRTAGETGNPVVAGAADSLAPAIVAWTRIALRMKEVSGDRKALRDGGSRKEALADLAREAEAVYYAEREFYRYLTRELDYTGEEEVQ